MKHKVSIVKQVGEFVVKLNIGNQTFTLQPALIEEESEEYATWLKEMVEKALKNLCDEKDKEIEELKRKLNLNIDDFTQSYTNLEQQNKELLEMINDISNGMYDPELVLQEDCKLLIQKYGGE